MASRKILSTLPHLTILLVSTICGEGNGNLQRTAPATKENTFMFLNTRSALPLATAFLLGFTALAQAKTVKISGNFVTEGTATTKPVGHVSGTFNTVTDKVTYHIVYSGLSGPVIAAHFHGPAGPTTEAP